MFDKVKERVRAGKRGKGLDKKLLRAVSVLSLASVPMAQRF